MEKTATSNTGGPVDPSHNEFFNTGRVGRRNAMPDILGQHCRTTTADLPDQLSALTTNDGASGSRSISPAAGAEPVAGCSNAQLPDAAALASKQPDVISKS